ncbi:MULTISPECIES: VOC family protein [Bacillus]|uniref:VOC family protein n=1 Tax=Bacillus TaxID=1386 RepID=UPI0001A167F8|nr:MULTISPECIES: VOC family protein [Bacillus]EEM05064.1 Lactoylglutathione lyase [Bacillus pseudomycoides]KFN14064.1 glyoxalase/Bleomycin resistance /Dioxygenase superfamily protein [Bacillus pseudomycoides]MDR4189731.1 VOC family protein [Bacillus pseudomycoides]MED0856647.1 VOC family protein [Bacillus pseudomycoides]PEK33260.1 VOC family protein [Bacillus pseudomycoides]
MPVRRIEHVGIMVANLETSLSFYEEVIGLKLIKRMGHPDPNLKLAFLGVEESQETILELIEGYNPSLPAEGKVHHICFKVDSLEDEIERLKKLGVTFLLTEEIETLPDGTRYIFFSGRDGEWIEFFETE